MTTQQIWSIHSDDIKRFIVSKVKNTAIADDILQNSFIKIHTKLHTLNDLNKVKSWTFTIARNAVMDYFNTPERKQNNTNIIATEAEYTAPRNKHTERDCLHGILLNLPKKYRDPLFLADIKGLKQQEIAKQLNQTLSTTKSQIQRARKLIAKGFMDCCDFVVNKKGKLVGEIQDKEDCKICSK